MNAEKHLFRGSKAALRSKPVAAIGVPLWHADRRPATVCDRKKSGGMAAVPRPRSECINV